MYSEDPKNRKAPSILLGFIAITGALILALFLTGILKAHAETDLPYNYIAFVEITNSNVTFNDMSGEVLYSLPTFSGAPIPNQNYEAALNNLLAYIPASECLVFIVDNLATKAVYEYVLDSFISRYVNVLEVNTTIFPFDLTGYEIGYYPAGMWNVPIYTKSVPLTPTPSPSPTPTIAPLVIESLLFYGSPRYGSSPFSSNGYYLFDFIMESTPESVEVELQDNSSFAFAMSNYNVESPWVNNVILHYANDSYSNINIYLKGICTNVHVYYLGNALASEDYDLLRQSYSYQEFVNNTSYSYWTTSKGITGMNLYFNYDTFNFVSSSFTFNNQTVFLSPGSLINLFSYGNGTANTPIVQAYRYGLSNSEYIPGGPSPTVSPPTPTQAPHVIINWPSGTPTPTPPFSVPGNSGTGSGSSGSGALSPGQIDSTLDTFKTYTENNNAFAFLYACTSVIPDEALYFLFILLFIMLMLACIRLFVHFTG